MPGGSQEGRAPLACRGQPRRAAERGRDGKMPRRSARWSRRRGRKDEPAHGSAGQREIEQPPGKAAQGVYEPCLAGGRGAEATDLLRATAAPTKDAPRGERAEQQRQQTPARPRKGLRVSFDLDAVAVHEVVPYAEIYSVHPRDFVFGRGYCMIPAINHVGLDVLFGAAPSGDSEVELSDSEHSDSELEQGEAPLAA